MNRRKKMSKRITISADGTVLTLKDRNLEILNNLQPTLANQLEKKQQNMYLKKPFQLKFGAVINNKLLELFRGYGLMTEEDLQELDAEDLKDYYLHFMDLVNTISVDIEITPTKPLFCAYMGITVKIFNKLEKHEDAEVRRWFDAINGDFVHSLFDSSLQGNANEKSSLTFAATKEYGQETVQNDFSATITTKQEVEYTPAQALDVVNNIKGLIESASTKKLKEKRK